MVKRMGLELYLWPWVETWHSELLNCPWGHKITIISFFCKSQHKWVSAGKCLSGKLFVPETLAKVKTDFKMDLTTVVSPDVFYSDSLTVALPIMVPLASTNSHLEDVPHFPIINSTCLPSTSHESRNRWTKLCLYNVRKVINNKST